MLDQSDLFGAPARAASPFPPSNEVEKTEAATPAVASRGANPVSLLPTRPLTWQRLLARAALHPIELLATTLWTGVVVETLSDPTLGRNFLCQDGQILPYPPDAVPKRVVFFTVDGLNRLASRTPLVIMRPAGSHSVLCRFANPGEWASPDLAAVLAGLIQEAP